MKLFSIIENRFTRLLLPHLGAACVAVLAAVTLFATSADAQRREVPILLYGQVGEDGGSQWRVTESNFEQHMQTLASQGFETITIGEYLDHIDDPSGNPLDENSIILTFINGYRSVIETVDPILEEHGFTATAFLVTDVIGDTQGSRQDSSWDTQDPGPDVDHLIWPEVRQLVDDTDGRWEIGSHSRTHARLTNSGVNLQSEIAGSQSDIESGIGGGYTVRYFSYPNGAHNQEIRDLVGDNYDAGLGVQGVSRTSHDDVLALPRLYIQNPHGSDIMARIEGEPHPADIAQNWRIGDSELTTYISDWLAGDDDIPDSFLSQGIEIWLSGGAYTYNPQHEGAQRWAPGE